MSELTEGPVKMHRVSYSLSYTKNMGDFESLKVQVGLEQDGQGHPSATLDKVKAWVADELGKAVKETVEAIEGR